MITDLFIKRYPSAMLWSSERPPWLDSLLVRLTHLVFDDLLALISDRNSFCKRLHDRVARELGVVQIAPGRNPEEICGRFLASPYNLWDNEHRDLDFFFKSRLSLVELAFRLAEESHSSKESIDEKLGGLLSWAGRSGGGQRTPTAEREALNAAINELNARFQEARLPLRYHKGCIQGVDDPLTSKEIEEPFWALLADEKWRNVSADIQEAIDRRDSGGRDSALYSMKALESAIKIVSESKGWTRGTERGAADFINNLADSKNGSLLAGWEAELLKALFSKVRNPHGHGPGTSPMPQLDHGQETWVLESCMIWIKSLARRL